MRTGKTVSNRSDCRLFMLSPRVDVPPSYPGSQMKANIPHVGYGQGDTLPPPNMLESKASQPRSEKGRRATPWLPMAALTLLLVPIVPLIAAAQPAQGWVGLELEPGHHGGVGV